MELLDTFMPLHYQNVKSMLQGLSDAEKSMLAGFVEEDQGKHCGARG